MAPPHQGQNIVDTRLLLVTDSPVLRHEACAAAERLGVPIDVLPNLESALSWLLRPGQLCTHVLVPADINPQHLDALAGMIDEVTSRPTPVLLLGGAGDQGPSVLAVDEGAFAAIAHTLRNYLPFVPEKMPGLTAAELRTALHGGQLRMRFQPILDAASLDPIGMEALARLHHPLLGILRPGDFMPQAVASGQERIVTSIVAARAMLDLRGLPGLPERNFNLNVPLSSLCHPDAVPRACELCAVAGVEPCSIVIELLETAEQPDLSELGAAVSRWRAAGFLVSIDDAGPRLGALAGAARSAVYRAETGRGSRRPVGQRCRCDRGCSQTSRADGHCGRDRGRRRNDADARAWRRCLAGVFVLPAAAGACLADLVVGVAGRSVAAAWGGFGPLNAGRKSRGE